MEPLRILVSYHYFQNSDLGETVRKHFTEPYPEIFVDSGGFTAKTLGAQIDMGKYAAWIKRHRAYITTYANLDEIGDAKRTWANQQRMEQEHGLSPLPVFHTGEDFAYLDRYIERYSYIALGGLVPYAGAPKIYMPWLVKCFKRAQGKAVFHGFGVTGFKPLVSFPWYSVDSSAWGQGFRYGAVPIFDDRLGRFFKLRLGDRKGSLRHAPLIRSYGFAPLDFGDRAQNTRAKNCALSALSYRRLEGWLRRRFGVIQIPGGVDVRGGRIYLADSAVPPTNHELADRGLKLYLAEVQPDMADIRHAHREAPAHA